MRCKLNFLVSSACNFLSLSNFWLFILFLLFVLILFILKIIFYFFQTAPITAKGNEILKWAVGQIESPPDYSELIVPNSISSNQSYKMPLDLFRRWWIMARFFAVYMRSVIFSWIDQTFAAFTSVGLLLNLIQIYDITFLKLSL